MQLDVLGVDHRNDAINMLGNSKLDDKDTL